MKTAFIFTYYWPPSGGAGVQRWVKFAKYFPLSGIKPVIITVDAEKASYPIRDASLLKDIAPDIEVYRTHTFEPLSLYKTFTKSGEIPYGGFANEGKPGLLKKISRFIRGNFFIPDARIGWNRYAYQQALQVLKTQKPSVIITTSPPHSTQLLGLRLKEKFSFPWIADLRDPWTEIYYYDKMLHTSFAREKDLKLERKVLENADAIIVVSRAIRDAFLKKSPWIEASKFHIIPNGFDEDDFKEELKMPAEDFVITYTGTITSDYRLQSFIRAMQKMIFTYGKKIKFRFVGSLPKEVHQELMTHLGDAYETISHVSHAQAIAYMRSASALLLVIPDTADNKGILTGKLFEYLASRRPIIGIGPLDGEAAEIVDTCSSGHFFGYEDEKGLFLEIENLYLNALQGKAWDEEDNKNYLRFSRQKQTEELALLVERLSEKI